MIKESIVKFLKLETLIGNLTGFVETRIELMKLELKEDISKVVSKILVYVGAMLIFTFCLLFVSLAAALHFSELWGSLAGFGLVSLIYLVIGVTLLLLKDPISKTLEAKLGEMINRKK